MRLCKVLMIEDHPRKKGYKRNTCALEIQGHRIPAGTVWNGASIPWIFWWITGTPFDDKYLRASLLHDRLYDTGAVSRAEADMLFYKQLLEDGVSSFVAWSMYRSVRAFAAGHYNN